MDAITLEQLQNPASAYYSEITKGSAIGSTGNIRLDAVREAAFGVGVRGGLKARSDELSEALNQVGRQLDVTYDFRPYVIQGRVLPPIVVESRDIYTQGSDTALRLAGRSYKIEAQARFVSRMPTWREYLDIRYQITPPAPALLPKTPEETTVWQTAVADGWAQGREQADRVFNMNFDRLDRDFLGMVRFHKLVEANMVTMPIIAQSSSAITGNASSMSVDERLLRITVLPSFNIDITTWTPRPVPSK